MTTTHQRYADALAPLTAVIDAVPPGSWDDPSPCEGWTSRDVLTHVVQTQRDFLAERGGDVGPDPDLGTDPAVPWRDHAERVATLLRNDGFTGTAFDGHFGPTTVGETFVRFYVWDMVVHRWDLARATGVGTRFTEAELDQVEQGAAGFGEALHMPGICGPALDVTAAADRTTRVLALVGRAR